MRFNSPPGWPTPPAGWTPPPGWRPPSTWPEPPPGWQLFIPDDAAGASTTAGTDASETGSHGEGATAESADRVEGDTDISALQARIAHLESALAEVRGGGGVIDLDDQRILQEAGIYRYHHPLENAPAYKERLDEIETRIGDLVKSSRAVLAADMFTFDGSLAKGRKMVADFSRLMLRAYNAEAENCVRSLRSGNVQTAQRRLEAAMAAIERLGALMEMRVNPEYHALRVDELELTADFQMKLQEERELAREERELLREQRQAEQELAAERERLEKERAHYARAIEAMQANGDLAGMGDLADRLAEIDQAIEANDYRIVNIRAGYVYVISNIGAFGPNVVKIGMTRRLDPLDRVRELGDASVPFKFDVHAIFFSEDAIKLEASLHRAFAERRVNVINERREFFFATPAEVREILAREVGGLLEFTEQPEALEYFQSRAYWPNVTESSDA